MKNLNQVIQEALSEINFEEIAKEAAVKKVQEVVRESVDSQLKSYSAFGEKLKEHLKGEMSVDFSKIKLPEYRAFLVEAVNKSLVKFTTEDHAKEITKFINKEVLGESRSEIEFSMFWDELCAMIKDECDGAEYEVEMTPDDSSWSSRTYWRLKISVKKDSYSSKDKSEVFYAAFSEGKIYHTRHEDTFELSRTVTWLKALKYRSVQIKDIEEESATVHNHGDY